MDPHKTHSPESVEQLARIVFTDLYRAIIHHESGSIDGSVESVHGMRVAVRRLRVTLSNFEVCLRKEDRKRLRSRLENLAEALGDVRDMDVMISAMKSSLSGRSEQEKIAISELIGRLRARRRSRLRALINYLQGEEYAAFKHEFSFEWIKSEPESDPDLAEPETPELVEEVVKEVIEEEHGQAA